MQNTETDVDIDAISLNLDPIKLFEKDSDVHNMPRLTNKNSDGSKPIEFVPPTEGTPAAQALAANAAIKVSKVSKGFHKLRGLKRPKMKSLNLVKKLNKTTKTKRERKHFSTNFKGKVIDGVHELYTLTAGMMLGIRYSIGKNHSQDSGVMDVSDFNYVEKVTFPPKGNTDPPHITPMHSLAHTFKFKSYSPRVFKRLRDFFGIDAASYMISVCGDYNFIEFISNSKSGQFFFYSHDGKYMIKTQTKEENKFMKRILPHYYKFLTENPFSMLVQILGMHRVKMYHLRRKVHFVIMASVFDSPAQINTIYDLKGSLVGRSATEKERSSGGVLKDNDLIIDKRSLHLGAKKTQFVAQLEKDALFLASLNIMDYSLLVGIHDRQKRHSNHVISPQFDGSMTHSAHVSGTHSVDCLTKSLSVQVNVGNTTNSTAPVGGAVRSNTPFRRSIHVTSVQDSRQNSLVSNLTDVVIAKDFSNGEEQYQVDVSHKVVDSSPVRKQVKRLSSNNSNKLNAVFDKDIVNVKLDLFEDNTYPIKNDDLEIELSKAEAASNDHPVRLKKTFSRGQDGLMVSAEKFSHHAHHSHQNVAHNTQHHSHAHHKQHNHQYIDSHRGRSSSSSHENDQFGIDVLNGPDRRGSGNSFATMGSEVLFGHYVVRDEGENDMFDHEEGDEDEDDCFDEESYDDDDEFDDCIDEGDSDCNNDDIHWSGGSGEPTVNNMYDNLKGNESELTFTREIVREDGLGAMGAEGGHLHSVLRDSFVANRTDRVGVNEKSVPVYTYGPGATRVKPWTSRKDGGVNAHGVCGREDDIYFIGIIDILQQYNLNKKVETLYKGLTHDSKQISSVDPMTYAKRFVKFMEDNIE